MPELPSLEIAGKVNEALASAGRVVVTAPPGAGKSTLLPVTIFERFGAEGRILMLEPRRIAARSIAERMAWIMGEEAGRTVGYRIRKESRISSRTKIEVVTERILTRMIVDDPTLEGIGCIIFDEFHERNLNSDVGLALALESQRTIREDLKIVIMSATIDAEDICTKLGASLVESGGRMFPVDIVYNASTPDVSAIAGTVSDKIREALRKDEGDILAFLPGEAEIRQCARLLGEGSETVKVYPLYGQLDKNEQKKAIAPAQPGERKIVLATPVAETSLTIEGVRVVVDSGLCRKMAVQPCHPRIAKMMVSAEDAATRALVEEIAEVLEDGRFHGKRGWSDPYAAGRLLALAYPERIGKALGNGRFLLAGGDMASVDHSDPLAACDWLAVAEYAAKPGSVCSNGRRTPATCSAGLRPSPPGIPNCPCPTSAPRGCLKPQPAGFLFISTALPSMPHRCAG